MKKLFAFFLISFFCLSSQATILKCVNNDGTTTYTDGICTGDKVEVLDIKNGSTDLMGQMKESIEHAPFIVKLKNKILPPELHHLFRYLIPSLSLFFLFIFYKLCRFLLKRHFKSKSSGNNYIFVKDKDGNNIPIKTD